MRIFITGSLSFAKLKNLHEKISILYGKNIQFMHTATTDIVKFETEKERYKVRIKALLESDILVILERHYDSSYYHAEVNVAEHCNIKIMKESDIDKELLKKLMKERDDQNEAAEKLKVIHEYSGSGENANDEQIGKFCYNYSDKLRPVDFDGDVLYYAKFIKDAGDKTNLCDGCGFKERCGNRKDVDRIYCPGYVPDDGRFTYRAHVRRNDASSSDCTGGSGESGSGRNASGCGCCSESDGK